MSSSIKIISEPTDQEKSTIREEMRKDLLQPLRKTGLTGKVWIALLVAVCLVGLYAYSVQLRKGLVVTAMREYASWGLYISNFVFFVAISLVGALVSSILRLTNFSWYRPITRIAEIIAFSSIIFAGLIIIVDMGRPDRFYFLFTHGRIQSAIIWDVIVVSTYLVISMLLLWVPMLPSIAICREQLKDMPAWQRKMYRLLALGWNGTERQWKLMKKATRILCVLVIPVAISIHTVTAWLFATTLRPGWDSTNFGPYFIAGAFLAGTGCVIIAMSIFRKSYHLEKYLTEVHFDNMGKLMAFLAILYAYFNVNEYLVPAYKMRSAEAALLQDLFTGPTAPLYWLTQAFGMALPAIALLFQRMRRPGPVTVLAVLVVMGAWFKRYLIVSPIMLHPYLPIQDVPESWMHYFPSWVEMAVVGGSLAGVLLVITILSRLFPVISIWEVLEGHGIDLEELDKKSK